MGYVLFGSPGNAIGGTGGAGGDATGAGGTGGTGGGGGVAYNYGNGLAFGGRGGDGGTTQPGSGGGGGDGGKRLCPHGIRCHARCPRYRRRRCTGTGPTGLNGTAGTGSATPTLAPLGTAIWPPRIPTLPWKGGLLDFFTLLVSNGTAEHPDAGLLFGNGYSYTAADLSNPNSQCQAGSCNGGSGGWLIGNGGNGFGGGNGGSGRIAGQRRQRRQRSVRASPAGRAALPDSSATAETAGQAARRPRE